MAHIAEAKPYSAILESVQHDPVRIQALLESDWDKNNTSVKAKFMDEGFKGVQTDPILVNLLQIPSYEDPRNCLCVWARPTKAVIELVAKCQDMLKELNLWVTPEEGLHMTVTVMAHSVTPEALASLVPKVTPSLRDVARLCLDRRVRLVKPRISFDDRGVALSYVTAAEDSQASDLIDPRYTFLHLRRDIFDLCQGHIRASDQKLSTSCYIALARFTTDKDHATNKIPNRTALTRWVNGIEKINQMLAGEYWSNHDIAPGGGNWVVGGRDTLEIRQGRNWYGGGHAVDLYADS